MSAQEAVPLEPFERIVGEQCALDDDKAAASRRLLSSFFIMMLFFVVITPLGSGDPVFDPNHQRPFWVHLIAGTVAFGLIVLMGRRRLARVRRDPAAAAVRMKREFDQMTEAGWSWRALKMGLLMGLFIGITIAALIVFVPQADSPPFDGRVREGLLFVGGTFLWTIPTAFAIRWLSVMSMRKAIEKQRRATQLG